MTIDPSDKLLTYRDVSELLGVTYVCVRRWACNGLLPVIRITKSSVRIRRSALEAWMAARTSEPTALARIPEKKGATGE